MLTLRRSTYCLYCHNVFESAHQRLEVEAKPPTSDRRGRVWDSDSEHYKEKGRLPFCLLAGRDKHLAGTIYERTVQVEQSSNFKFYVRCCMGGPAGLPQSYIYAATTHGSRLGYAAS